MTQLNTLKKISLFFIMLFAVFLPVATFTLVLVVRSFIIFMRNSGWLQGYEQWVILGLLFLCLLYSCLFAKWLTNWFLTSKNRSDKNFFLINMLILLFLTCLYWFIPRASMQNEWLSSKNNQFVGGPYPDNKELALLKSKGYTVIISLLDPIGLPAEPWLYLKEKINARRQGMKLINIPIMIGHMNHLDTIKQISELAKNGGKDKYYVHAYYGRDRVQIFIALVDANTFAS